MNLTAKSRYALKIMMDLAAHAEQGHQQRQSIALRQSIPLDFMDQITARLRAKGLIESIRGRSGGFFLVKPPQEISLWDIFQAVEDNLYAVKCMDHESCNIQDSCISVDAWNDVYGLIRNALSQQKLSDSVEKSKRTSAKSPTPREVSVSTQGSCDRPH